MRDAVWENRIVAFDEQPVEQMLANPQNWRLHGEAQQDALEGVLNDVGYVAPIVVNDRTGYVVDGHLRVQLAMKRGQAMIPVIHVNLSADEEAEVLATLDPISAMAGTHRENLAHLLDTVATEQPAVMAMLQNLRTRHVAFDARVGHGDEDAVPPLPTRATVRAGELWALGPHRLFCGDAREPEHQDAATERRDADLLITDPPYGVEYRGHRSQREAITGDDDDDAATFALVRDALQAAPLAAGAAFYVFSPAGRTETAFRRAVDACADLELHQCLVWVKQHFVMGRQDYHWRHESILYGWAAGAGHAFYGGRTQDTVIDDDVDLHALDKADLHALVRDLRAQLATTVIEEDKPHTSPLHPTMKPVALVRRLMANSSLPTQLVLDPFAGSGTTIIAAEQLDRRCAAVELEPAYGDVIIERWQDFSGGKAIRL